MPTKPITSYYRLRKTRKNWSKRKNYGTTAGRRALSRSSTKVYNPRTLVKQGLCFPRSSLVSMRYADEIQYTGTPAYTHSFRANSLFDPDYTGTGHQPMGFDQWSNFYSKYRVRSITVELHACSTGTQPVTMAFCVENDNTVSSNPSEVAERNSGDYRVIAQSGQQPVVFKKTYNMEDIAGQSIEDEEYAALVTANPAKPWFWNLSVAAMDGSSAIAGHFLIVITYNAELTDPNDLQES